MRFYNITEDATTRTYMVRKKGLAFLAFLCFSPLLFIAIAMQAEKITGDLTGTWPGFLIGIIAIGLFIVPFVWMYKYFLELNMIFQIRKQAIENNNLIEGTIVPSHVGRWIIKLIIKK